MARRILQALQLDKIAAVDRPCQEGATVAILKRDNSIDKSEVDVEAIANMIAKDLIVLPMSMDDDDDDRAQSFQDALDEAMECKVKDEISSKMWPMQDALRNSIVSILQDDSLDSDSRLIMISNSVQQFLVSLRQEYPQLLVAVQEAQMGKRVRELRKRILVGKLGVINHVIKQAVIDQRRMNAGAVRSSQMRGTGKPGVRKQDQRPAVGRATTAQEIRRERDKGGKKNGEIGYGW
jgi:hypothetical protein